MKSYIYQLTVDVNGTRVRRFLGNDPAELQERFEMWFIKQPYDRADTVATVRYVQHAGY